MKAFASDNYSGIHPDILKAVLHANSFHEVAYGADTITQQANQLFTSIFGQVKVLYAFNGTGANVIALKCCALPFQAVVCTDVAHIHVDECGAPTQSIGCSLLPVKTPNGKLTCELIKPLLQSIGNVHQSQPKVISLSQSTELGTVYSVEELKEICEFAHAHDMYVHVDGARIANAIASLGVGLKEATVDCGVDIMSFGGTKNGMMMGEAILIFNEELKKHADFYQKQTAQLYSKNRFIAAQFIAFLTNNLWYKMASHANDMAQLLAAEIRKIPGITITRKVDANGVFACLPKYAIAPLQQAFPFYVWDENTHEVRWMCSFDTDPEDIMRFVQELQHILVPSHT